MSTGWGEEQSNQVITGEWVSWAVEISLAGIKPRNTKLAQGRTTQLSQHLRVPKNTFYPTSPG